jgi:hypothetical protein
MAPEPDVRELFDAVRRDDPARTIEQFGSLVAAFQYRKLYRLTRDYVLAGTDVLDWGCGRGHFATSIGTASPGLRSPRCAEVLGCRSRRSGAMAFCPETHSTARLHASASHAD